MRNRVLMMLLCAFFCLLCRSQENKTVQLDKDNTLSLKLNTPKKNYYVQIIVERGSVDTPDACKQKDEILYAVSVEWIEITPERRVVKIDRLSDVFVNQKASDLTIPYNLAIRTSAALYPITLSVDNEGRIENVLNHREIMDRWESTERLLRADFKGEGLDKYLKECGKAYNQIEALKFSLANDYFLNGMLNSAIYTSYPKGISKATKIGVPFLFDVDSNVEFTVDMKLNNKINNEGIFTVEFDGEYSDERSLTDLESELAFPMYEDEKEVDGQCFGVYFLEPQYNSLVSGYIHTEINFEIPKSIYLLISEIKKDDDMLAKLPDNVGGRYTPTYIPLNVFSDLKRDVLRHLNPLMDVDEMTLPERTHQGITIE